MSENPYFLKFVKTLSAYEQVLKISSTRKFTVGVRSVLHLLLHMTNSPQMFEVEHEFVGAAYLFWSELPAPKACKNKQSTTIFSVAEKSTNSMAYVTRRFNAAFTRAPQ